MTLWRRSIRFKLAAAITASLAVILAFATVISYFIVSDQLFREIDATLARRQRTLVSLLSQNADAAGIAANYERDSIPVDRTFYLQILSRDGTTLYRSAALAGLSLPSSLYNGYGTFGVNRGNARYETYASSWYYLTIALPVGDIDESLRILRLTFLIAVPLALIATLFIGYRIAKNGLHPIDAATAAARRITSHNLRERLPSPNFDDEVGRLVQTLNEMIERLESSFASISEFTTNAAHELRTPLTIMRGELEVELRDPACPPAQRAIMESAVEEVNRLIRIVENLFILSRADSHELALTLREVHLGEMLRSLESRAETIAAQKSISVRLECAGECTVIGDGEMLAQVVLNIVENAVKYSPEHSEIVMRLDKRDGEATISIADEGIGIEAEHQELIFERFFRADKARNRNEGGTGLGLAIAQSIVQAHNGAIRVESSPGKGSVFIVSLPLAEIE